MTTPSAPTLSAPKVHRGKGWKRDLADQKPKKTTRHLFGGRARLPNEVANIEPFIQLIVDQQQTSSCVGQAIGGALDTRLHVLGRMTAPPVSREAIYTIARSMDRPDATTPLQDNGSQPALAMMGLKQWGVPTAAKYPFDPNTINNELPWDVLQEASAYEIQDWFGIETLGKQRILDVCQALSMGYPVAFGVDVDQAFEDTAGTQAAPVGAVDQNAILGGHMMYLVGYTTNPDGSKLLRGVNSWGVGWANNGLYWAQEQFFDFASDFYVIQIA